MAEIKWVAYFNQVSVKQAEVYECFVKIVEQKFIPGKSFANDVEPTCSAKAIQEQQINTHLWSGFLKKTTELASRHSGLNIF